jgi:hypothetical protein
VLFLTTQYRKLMRMILTLSLLGLIAFPGAGGAVFILMTL